MEMVGDYPVAPNGVANLPMPFSSKIPMSKAPWSNPCSIRSQVTVRGHRSVLRWRKSAVPNPFGSWPELRPTEALRPNRRQGAFLARRMLLSQRQHAKTYGKLKDALLGLISSLTAAIDARTRTPAGIANAWPESPSASASRWASRLLLSDIYLAGLLHDIGKIGIEDSVLRKPTKLTEAEFIHIKNIP